MLLSVSRRTDIPAYYADWFFARLREGFVLVRNPVNPHSVARVSLLPEVIDGIVFWTKNPVPMLDRLDALSGYPYYFQFTLTSYGTDIEPGIPGKGRVLLPAFQRLSDKIGPDRVIWRYDPILLNPAYTAAYHEKTFDRMARRLQGYTDTCVLSFIDDYKSTARNAQALRLSPLPEATMRRLAASLSGIARGYGIAVNACAEALDLTAEGVVRAACVDAARMTRISGQALRAGRDKNQRPACGCSASIDLGAYNTCPGGCLYCYANYDDRKIPRQTALHDPAGPLLFGTVGPEDTVYERAVASCADPQQRLI